MLFQADGHIELRYYQFPSISSPVTIGISGSSSDYITLLNNAIPSFSTILALTGGTISFTPTNFVQQPYFASPPSITTSAISSYNATYSQSLSATPPTLSSTAATVFSYSISVVSAVPIGFAFNFYNITYNYAILSTNGNIQFATASVVTSGALTLSTYSPIIAYFFIYIYTYPSFYYQTTGTGRLAAVPTPHSKQRRILGSLAVRTVRFH